MKVKCRGFEGELICLLPTTEVRDANGEYKVSVYELRIAFNKAKLVLEQVKDDEIEFIKEQFMDNEEDYIELHRSLAKCKWNMTKEQMKLNSAIMGHETIINYYEKKIRQIDEFIVDIPIIIKGDER